MADPSLLLVPASLVSPAQAWSDSPAYLPLLVDLRAHWGLASMMSQPLQLCGRRRRGAVGVEETPGNSLLSPCPCRGFGGGGQRVGIVLLA